MLKIVCKQKFDPAKDAGAKNGDMEIVKQWCERSPHLRPCGMFHAWVEKSYCKSKCKHCVKWME